MKWLFAIAVLTAIIIVWATYVRPWLKERPWALRFFLSIEPIETWIYKKSETILVARYSQFLGFVLTILGFAGQIDWTLVAIVTPDWIDPYLPLMPTVLNIIGAVFERLRNNTARPLEVVAAPEAVKAALPEVKAMEQAKVAAVEAVKEAEADRAP